MYTYTFVTGIPVSSARVAGQNAVLSVKSRVDFQCPRPKAVVQMKTNGEKPDLPKIPQGFTPFSEELNGRVAMMGFILAVVTELLNPEHPGIAAQVGSIFDILKIAHASSM